MTTQLAESTASEMALKEATEQSLGSVIAENAEELADDLSVLDSGTIGGTVDTANRSKLMAFADRLLKRLAGDEGETDDITAAAKAEVALVTSRYQALAQKVSKRAAWKRFCLERLTALLFPDGDAKTKSINLPYGTLSRKDYKPTFKLVDEAAAIVLAQTMARDKVQLTIESDLEAFENQLINVVREIEAKGSINGAIRAFIDRMVNCEAGTTTAALALKWGAVKKEPAVALYAQPTVAHPAGQGVEAVPARTVFSVEITEG